MSWTNPVSTGHSPTLCRSRVALAGCLALVAACSESGPEALAPASFDEVALEKETLAGKPLPFEPGTCPVGYGLSQEKVETYDVNGNGWVCLADDFSEIVDDDIGFQPCPESYVLVEAEGVGVPPDDNQNGLICSSKQDSIDDVIPEEPKGKSAKVNGHGNFIDAGKVKLVQDISFSFHAIPTGNGDQAKGQFEFHDRENGLEVHGVVECLASDATGARIIGTVTRSDDDTLPVGTQVVWWAEDNGEPGAGVDLVSRPAPQGGKIPKGAVEAEKEKETPGKDPCRQAIKKPATMLLITSGNIQLH